MCHYRGPKGYWWRTLQSHKIKIESRKADLYPAEQSRFVVRFYKLEKGLKPAVKYCIDLVYHLKLEFDILTNSKSAYMGFISIDALSHWGLACRYCCFWKSMFWFFALSKNDTVPISSMQIGSLDIFMEGVGAYVILCTEYRLYPTLLHTYHLGRLDSLHEAQNLVLCSWPQRCISNLFSILSRIFPFCIPIRIAVWLVYNRHDHEISTMWSPRLAIVDRYPQKFLQITESIISGTYI